ncbi:hypothetical protein L5515_012901 [Caenorhabditis briggsae]|uniref:G-patch domain-containing protein n=3 Tax=Caenorhabditis briggsae TaxID=6238 RepID=A0AAE9EYF3_CAEBR|nr:hypothetical protein L5515_012901 [Caenorhabditis briggsae]
MISLEEMLREAANEVLQSRIPHGYVLIPDYGQYWSEEQRMYYDPNTELFSRPDDETVYQLNADGTEFVLVERRKKTYWSSRCYKRRANELLGEREFKKFDQNDVNICEIALGMVDKVVKKEEDEKEKEYLRTIADNKVAMIKHRFNKVFKDNKRKKNPHRQYVVSTDESTGNVEHKLKEDDYFDWEDPFEENDVDEFSDGEEQEILMQQERFDQPPCLRIMDQQRRLHIVTISGGYIGSDRDCEVVMSNSLMPGQCAEFGFSEEAQCYSIEKLESSCFIQVNGNTVKSGSPVDLCQGDSILVNGEQFEVHVHFGNNTCPGCEPGLYVEEEKEVETIQAKNIRGEYARRKNLKQMMKSYGIRPDEELSQPIRKRPATGVSLQNIQRNDVPSTSSDMYGGCSAKPVEVGQRKFDLPASSNAPTLSAPKPLDSGNVGFKLLKSMGWSEGQGLGKEKQGHVEPVATEIKNNRQGLGNVKEQPKSYKDQILETTKKRFNEKR